MPDQGAAPSRGEVIGAIAAYSFCSGSMLLVNKLVLSAIPFRATVVVIQLLATTAFVLLGKTVGLPVDKLEWKHIRPWLVYVFAFVLGVYTNMSALAVSNVETVIVFRACTPIIVSVLDYLFMGRELPSTQSVVALVVVAGGAAGYMANDSAFAMDGWSAYYWVTLYLVCICFEMTYGKSISNSVPLKTLSGPVLYTNLLAIPGMSLFVLGDNELTEFKEFYDNWGLSTGAVLLLLLSTVVGTGISYSGWYCRSKVGAATFTMVGVMNKCLTVLANILVWDKHATPAGVACLVVSLVGGSMYRQAPLRENAQRRNGPAVQPELTSLKEGEMSA